MGKIKAIWKDRDNQLRYAGWMMQYSKPYIGRITFMMLLNLIQTMLTLLMVQVTKVIIDNAADGNGFVYLIVIYIAMIAGMQVLGIVSTLFSTMLNERFSFGIRKQIYEKIINAYWMDVKKYHTGDLMTRLTSDAGNIADGVVTTLPGIIQLSIQLLLVFLMLFYYSPLLAVFALLVAPVAAVSSWWFGKKLKTLQIKLQESESAYRSFMQESFANLLIVKAFANEDYSVDRLTGLRENRFYWLYRRTKMGVMTSTAMSVSFQAGYIAAFAYGALQISRKAITYGTMSVFLSLINQVQAPVMGLAGQIPKVVAVLASAGRVMELQDIPVEEKTGNNIRSRQIGVKVDNMSFGYTDEPVLEDVSIDIAPGEFVAIIGESGIGKTTLIRVLMSFVGNIKGQVTYYNELGETEAGNAGTREFIAYVPQGNTLFSGTVRENILMGNPDAGEEEVMEALKLASGYDFVMALPDGIDTVIGERGHGLSEGQAQRIAIARAFVRKAPFLILDEATSALDEATESAVIRGLKKLTPKPSCLIITHRKTILQYCDRELRIEDKRVKNCNDK